MNPVRAFHYTYVLLNSSGLHYTGCTSNLNKRMKEHSFGKSLYTKNSGPYELIYYEACLNKEDAYAREKYLKTGMGKRFIKNRLKKALMVTPGMNPVRASGINVDMTTAENKYSRPVVFKQHKATKALTG